MSRTAVGISPDNPHYFTVNGELRHLISSAEHYGALLNRAFDFERYLKALEKNGFNQTRVFSGTYFERPEDFAFEFNTLAPERELLPLFADSSCRALHPDYIARLRSLLTVADQCGVVVEFVLFCVFYQEGNYEDSPLYRPELRREDFFNELSEEQKHFVRLVMKELRPFDNVIVELINEPYWFVSGRRKLRNYLQELAEFVKSLDPGKLLAWNVGNCFAQAFEDVPATDVLNFHYTTPECVSANWHRNLPIVDDETGFLGAENDSYRQEAYLTLLSGAAGFSHLDMAYSVEAPEGLETPPAGSSHGGGKSFHRELRAVAAFLRRYDFSNARPDPDLLHFPGGACAALDLGDGRFLGYGAGDVKFLRIALPAGEYLLTCFDPLTGEKTDDQIFRSVALRADAFPVSPEGEALFEIRPV